MNKINVEFKGGESRVEPLRKIDKTVIGKLLRDHGVLKDWMV